MFAELSLHERLLRALAAQHITEPTPVQRQAIPPALAGRDLLVSAETGSGKTAAYLLPLLQRLLDTSPGRATGAQALILTPTRELARQVFKQAQQLCEFTSLHCQLISGGEDPQYQAARLRRNPEVVVGTPGRLLEHLQRRSLDCADLRVLVLDEADRMLDMGFGPDVSAIVAACNPQRQTLLFSATLYQRGLNELAGQLLRDPEKLILNPERTPQASIRQQIVPADHQAHKEQLLLWLLAHEGHAKALVFANTRERADQLERLLRRHSHRSGVLHGEREPAQRKRVIQQFREGRITTLVATDVAARGLDIEGVELVINFDMARSGDEYLHRIGRTGRAGREGTAIALITAAEWNLMVSIERYLHLHFERRTIEELKGEFQGPRKMKSSGKAAGVKKKKTEAKKNTAPKPKKRLRDKKQTGKRRVPTAQREADARGETGFQPLRAKPAARKGPD